MAGLRYGLMGAFVALALSGVFWPIFEISVVGPWIPAVSAVGVAAVWLWGRARRPPRYYAGYEQEYRKLLKSADLVPMMVRTSNQAGGGKGWTRWAVTVMPSSQWTLKPSRQVRYRAVIDTPDDAPPLNGETWLCAGSERYPELVVPIRRDPNSPVERVKQPNSRVLTLAAGPRANARRARTLLVGAVIVGSLMSGFYAAVSGERFGTSHDTEDAAETVSNVLTPGVIAEKVTKLIDSSGTSTFGSMTVSPRSISAEVLAKPGGREVDSVRLGFRDSFTREGFRTLSKDEVWREYDFSNFDAQAFTDGLKRGLEQSELTAGEVDSVTYEASSINEKSLIGRFNVDTEYGYGGVSIRDDGTVLRAFLPGGETVVFQTLFAPETREKAWGNLAAAMAEKAVSRVDLSADEFSATVPGGQEIRCDDIGCMTVATSSSAGTGGAAGRMDSAFTLANFPWDKYSLEELRYASMTIIDGEIYVRVSVPDQPERRETYDFNGKLVRS